MFLFAILFLVFETWRGWRAGFARASLNLAAVVLGSLVGYFAAQMTAAPFGGFKDAGGLIAGLVVGVGLGVFVFLVLWLTGIIFFKRTDHQATGAFRLFWGAGGAFFGFLLGALVLWSFIPMVRGLGALAEARVNISKDATAAAPSAQTTSGNPGAHGGQAVPPATPPPPPAIAVNMLKLKESLELGPAGKFVESVDLIPADYYTLIVQVGQIAGDPHAMMRFIEYPGIMDIMKNPKVAALLTDPRYQSAQENGISQTLTALMADPRLRAAAEDPALAEQLKKIDMRAALKFALEKPTPTPSPSPHTTKKPSAPVRD